MSRFLSFDEDEIYKVVAYMQRYNVTLDSDTQSEVVKKETLMCYMLEQIVAWSTMHHELIKASLIKTNSEVESYEAKLKLAKQKVADARYNYFLCMRGCPKWLQLDKEDKMTLANDDYKCTTEVRYKIYEKHITKEVIDAAHYVEYTNADQEWLLWLYHFKYNHPQAIYISNI